MHRLSVGLFGHLRFLLKKGNFFPMEPGLFDRNVCLVLGFTLDKNRGLENGGSRTVCCLSGIFMEYEQRRGHRYGTSKYGFPTLMARRDNVWWHGVNCHLLWV